MMTAGIAAARPMAVASSASAMPGATTARFVVWALEMPMKLFMMPHTVPNRPTKGAVEPIVARMPVPRETRRLMSISMRSSWRASAVAQVFVRLSDRRRFVENAEIATHLAAGAAQFQRLGEEHRPGDDR